MQAQEVLRQLRIPELDDVRQYMRALPTNALMGMGAFAAITTYWFATRPRTLMPPCDLTLQSIELPVCSSLIYVFSKLTMVRTNNRRVIQLLNCENRHQTFCRNASTTQLLQLVEPYHSFYMFLAPLE